LDIEGAQVTFRAVQQRGGCQYFQSSASGLYLPIDGERHGAHRVRQALLGSGTIAPGHVPSGCRTKRKRGQQDRKDEENEVCLQAKGRHCHLGN
jgi:hypothetical protein